MMNNPTPTPVVWRKSTRSTNASNCVEVAFTDNVGVRDSKNPEGRTLTVPTTTWTTFLGVLD
jgi:hypothetical protein